MRLYLLVATAAPVAIIAACLPHPADDFADYEDKTVTLRQAPQVDSGPPPDAAPPTEASKGKYFGTCFSQLAAGRTDRVLRFYTETSFVPTAGGAGGKLSFTLTPLLLPPTVTDAKTGTFGVAAKTGATYATAELDVDSKGLFLAPVGTPDPGFENRSVVKVPGNANPISGREIVIDKTQFKGRFADPAKFCALLSGDVVQPVQVNLEPAQNVCLFLALEEGKPYPDPVAADYVCNVD